MKPVLALFAVALLLSACGVEGPPVPPPPKEKPAAGVSVTGSAEAGVVLDG
mgnify:CR=1 FL=1